MIFFLSCSSSYFSESLLISKLIPKKKSPKKNIFPIFTTPILNGSILYFPNLTEYPTSKITSFYGNNFEMNLCYLTVVFRRDFPLDLILNHEWHNYLWSHDGHEHFDLHNGMKIRPLSAELDFLLLSRIYGRFRIGTSDESTWTIWKFRSRLGWFTGFEFFF